MKNRFNSAITVKVGCGLLVGMLARGQVYGCACGCTVFDVGTSAMLPSGQGGMAFMQYAYQDQNRNWSGTSEAPADNNDDKEIETHFATLGLQYMFNRSWGIQAEVPYDYRYFKTRDDAGNIVSRNWSQLGDIRLEGIYTGFSPDLSAGVTFGVKLPTGSFSYDSDVVDRDTQIGTGSTDILLGGFYRHNLGQTGHWDWFAQLQLDVPTLIQAEYRPGVELDAAAGLYYRGLQFGRVRVSPLAQVIFSERTSDSGAAAAPDNTGYQRLLLSPGIECQLNRVALYADAEFPVYQHFTGNQLTAPVMFKAILSYMF
jgi:Putative MetA-pathway of phenol degradation